MDLPQITIERPRLRFWEWVVLRMWPFYAGLVAFAIVGIESHKPGYFYGALGALGILIVLVAIEIPLALAAVARHQRKTIQSRSLPPGTLFAARGSQIGYLDGAAGGPAESRGGLRQGLLILDGGGVQFRISRVGPHTRDGTGR